MTRRKIDGVSVGDLQPIIETNKCYRDIMSMVPLIAHGQPIGMYPAPMMTPNCCPCVPPPVHVTTVILDHQHACRRGPRWINRSLRRRVLGLMGFTGTCAVIGGVICFVAGLGFIPVLVGVGVLAVPIIVGLVEIETSETRH